MYTERELIVAIAKKQHEELESFLASKPSLSAYLDGDLAMLHHAAMRGDIRTLCMLLDAGADPNQPSKSGTVSPLILAIQGSLDRMDIVKELLKRGADVNWATAHNSRAVDQAVRRSKLDILKELLAAGAEVNYGVFVTPLVSACQEGSEVIVQTLLDAGANINQSCRTGTPLAAAIIATKPNIVKLLLERGADPFQKLPDEMTQNEKFAGLNAFEIAEASKKAKILEILRSHQPEQEKAAASLPEAWKKIDSWLRAKKPKVLASLNPGIDEKSLGTLSKSVGATLPEDLVALLKIHDGQKDQEPAFLPSPDQDAPYALLPSANILKEWKLQNELLESGDFSRKAVADRGIQPVWWSAGWIPVAGNGQGDFICVDTAPTADGVAGQVIWYQTDSPNRQRLAKSLAEWLDGCI